MRILIGVFFLVHGLQLGWAQDWQEATEGAPTSPLIQQSGQSSIEPYGTQPSFQEDDDGGILSDDVRVREVPASTLAWWRFEEGKGHTALEETHRFFPGTYDVYLGEGWTSAPSALIRMFNGVEAVTDRYACINTSVDALTPNTVIGTIDWTLELVVLLDGSQSCTFFEWAATRPPESTSGTWIRLEWTSGNQTLDVRLRCDGRTTAAYESEAFSGLPRDGRWHHLALVKEGSKLSAYVDYVYVAGPSLSAAANGNYTFTTSSRAYIGQDHTGGDRAKGGIGFDEIRFSNSVFIDEFLRVDRPFFTGPPKILPLTADLTFVGTPWSSSEILRASSPRPASWTSCGSFTAAEGYIGRVKRVNVPKPSSVRGFYQIR